MDGRLRQILKAFRGELARIHGERLRGVYLFGSRARGDADEDSDIDVAVVLEGQVVPRRERERASGLTSVLSLENDIVISCVYLSRERYERGEGPLVRNIRAEGVPV